MPTVQVQFSGGETAGTTAAQDWLVMEQQQVPQSQKIATVPDIVKLLRYAMLQQSARAAVSDNCPVQRQRRGEQVIISYTATIFVHRSAGLDGRYDLIPSEGKLSPCMATQRKMRKDYDLEDDAILFLGWLPSTLAEAAWIAKIYNPEGIRVFAPEIASQSNGYLYFPEAYSGAVEVSGYALVDVYFLTIYHQQGYVFDRKILLTAEWGPEDVNGNRQSVQLEIKPPQCWIDEASKCAEEEKFGGEDDGGGLGEDDDGEDDGQGNWNFTLRRAHTILRIGFCSGKILQKLER